MVKIFFPPKEQRNKPWPWALIQFMSFWRPLILSLSLLTSRSRSQGPNQFLTTPISSFPGRRNQSGHQSPPGLLSKSLNRIYSRPELRVEEGVHAKSLCFSVRRSEVEGWVTIYRVRSGLATLPSWGPCQIWTCTVFLHTLHCTTQPQWNVRPHRATRGTPTISYP